MSVGKDRGVLAGFVFGLPALLARPAGACEGGHHDVQLAHGPVAAQVPRVLDLRTPYVDAPALILLSGLGGPHLPADLSLPALDVAANARRVPGATDATGRIRITLASQPAVGGPARLHLQALVLAPDGRWRTSAPATVRRSPVAPAGSWLVPSTASPLPASAAFARVHGMVACDLDRDGDRDLIAAHATGVTVWVDQGATGFADESAARITTGVRPVSCIATADVEGDGDEDLFAGGAIDLAGALWPDQLWLNDGHGFFALDPALPAGDGSTAAAEFGDIDADGWPDLGLACGTIGHTPVPGRCQLLRNRSGTFGADPVFAGMAWNDGLTAAPALRFGDVDEDGDLDAYVARSDGGAHHGGPGEVNRLLINDGSGTFADETASRFTQLFDDDTIDARFVDLDLDGDLDLIAVNSFVAIPPAQSGDVWINQGGLQGGIAGTFAEDPASPLSTLLPGTQVRMALHPADADVDGDTDLLVLIHDLPPGSRHLLFLNQGGAQGGALGQLALDTSFDPGAFIASAAAWVDRDHDGDPELLIGSAGTLTGPPSLASGVLWLENSTP